MLTWLREEKNGVLIRCHVQPGASKSELAGVHGDRIKIRIKAAPVEGKANKELIAFLSKLLGRPKSSMELVRGQTSKQKDVLCIGAKMDLITECFE